MIPGIRVSRRTRFAAIFRKLPRFRCNEIARFSLFFFFFLLQSTYSPFLLRVFVRKGWRIQVEGKEKSVRRKSIFIHRSNEEDGNIGVYREKFLQRAAPIYTPASALFVSNAVTIFQTQEAAANFSIPFRLPLFLRVVASNGSTSFIFVLLFEEKGGGGETRDEVNSKRQYTVRFIFETLDDDLSILSYEKRCEPRECAPTEEEVRPENGNSRLSIANESGDQSHPRDSFPDCSPIVSRSFLSDLKVFPLFFFFFSFFSFFLSTRLR